MRISIKSSCWIIATVAGVVAATLLFLRDEISPTRNDSHSVVGPERSMPTAAKVSGSLEEDSFEFPFVGRMQCLSRPESIKYAGNQGQAGTLDIKVFYNRDGYFLRAEYFREGSKDWEFPAKEAEENYAPQNERIVGVPGTRERASLEKVIENIRQLHDGKLEKATKFNITRVILASPKFEEPQEVFIANVFGTGRISDRLPDEEKFRRLRFVLDAEGQVLFVDNVL